MNKAKRLLSAVVALLFVINTLGGALAVETNAAPPGAEALDVAHAGDNSTGQTEDSAKGQPGGGAKGNDIVDTADDTAGGNLGGSAGDTAGGSSGDASGGSTGDTAGNYSGDSFGDTSGDSSGDFSGDTAGGASGDSSVDTTGGTAGDFDPDLLEEQGLLSFMESGVVHSSAVDVAPGTLEFFAEVGDIAVPIRELGLVPTSASSLGGPLVSSAAAQGWIDVTVAAASPGSYSETHKMYSITEDLTGLTPRGALFLEGLPAGDYTVTYETMTFANLKVLAAGTKYIYGLGGTEGGTSSTPLNSDTYGGMAFDWLVDLLDSNSLSIGSISSTYAQAADGSVYLSLYAANIKPSDITDVKVGGTSVGFSVIPSGRKILNSREYLLKIANPAGTGISVSVEVSGIASPYTASITRSSYSEHYQLDLSEIDSLKLHVTYVGAGSAPASINIRIFDDYYSEAGSNTLYNQTLPLTDGRYTLTLDNNKYIFSGPDENVYVYIYDSDSEPASSHLYDRIFSKYDILYIGFPTDSLGIQAQILAGINGQDFWIHQYYDFGNIYRTNMTFSLVDASFNPVNTVTVEQSDTFDVIDDIYVFKASQPLTVGSVYYLCFGSLPFVKLTAVSSYPPGTGSDTYRSISGDSLMYAGKPFTFGVFMTQEVVNASQYKVKLTNMLTDTPQEYTIGGSAGSDLSVLASDSDYVDFATSNISAGVYQVDYYRNGVLVEELHDSATASHEFHDVRPRYIIAVPVSGVSVGWTYHYSDPSTRETRFGVSGVSSSSGSVSGLRADFYPLTKTSIDIANVKGVALASADVSNGEFWSSTPASTLRAAGIVPGFYYAVIKDSSGNVKYVNFETITNTFLGVASGGSVSGIVTLGGAARGGVAVELYRGAAKIADTVTDSSGRYSFGDLERNVSYTIKIPEGATWEAHEETFVVTGAMTRNVVLTYRVPTYEVSGIVTAEGQPVSGYRFSVYDSTAPTSAVASVTTQAGGAYSFRVPDGTYIIRGAATDDFKEFESTGLVVSGEPVENHDFALVYKPYIAGVTTFSSTPIAGVYVYLYEVPTPGSFIFMRSTTTNAAGEFRFRGLEENTNYRLSVYHDQYAAPDTEAETGVAGMTQKDITLSRLIKISGTVKFDGNPIGGMYVKLQEETPGSASWYAYVNATTGYYEFMRIPVGDSESYSLSIAAGRDYQAYNLAPFTPSDDTVKDIALQPIIKYKVTFTTDRDLTASETFDLYVTTPYGVQKAEGSGDEYTINLPDGDYTYFYYYNGVYVASDPLDPIEVSGEGVYEVEIDLPTLYTISGKVVEGGGGAVPVQGAVVSIWGAVYASVTTDANGDFSVSVKDGTPTAVIGVDVYHPEKGYDKKTDSYTSNTHLDVGIFTLKQNSVVITVTDSSSPSNPIPGAYVYVGGHSGYTNQNGEFRIVNTPNTSPGYLYVSKPGYLAETRTPFAIAPEGETSVTIPISIDQSMYYTFALKQTSDELASDGYISITPVLEYSGTGTSATGTITITLPEGLIMYDGGTNTYDAGLPFTLVDGKPPKFAPILVTADTANAKNLAEFNISAVFSGSDTVNKYAYAHVTIVDATLSAPSIVVADEIFNVYGIASKDSIVKILDDAGNTLKTIGVEGRYFHTTLTLPAGEHELKAVATKAGAFIESKPVSVTALDGPAPTIANIQITEGYLSRPVTNPAYGFPTFSTWVLLHYNSPYQGQYRGIKTIRGSFDVNNLGGYTVKSVSFTDAIATGQFPGAPSLTRNGNRFSFVFPIYSWGGVGVQPILVTLEKDGREYLFTISLVTLLIDPSGYVFDSLTGEKIEGATVTVETKPDGENWAIWVDPDAIQSNPMPTDDEGKYGWFVPKGEYRVVAEKENYARAIANKEDGTFDEGNIGDGFEVPPEQTGVNIPLYYIASPTAAAKWEDGKLVITFDRPMYEEATKANIVLEIDGVEIEGDWQVSPDGRVFTFTPTTAPAKGKTITISIDPSTMSQDDIAIGAFTIPSVTIPLDSTGPGGTGGGGGNGVIDASSFTVRFETNGGSLVPNQTIVPNGKVIRPDDPEKEGFVFGDWHTDIELTEEYDFNLAVTSSFTLYASWTEDNDKTTAQITSDMLRDGWLNPYSDVSESDWFFDAVRFVSLRGLMVGTGDGAFSPNMTLTRAMLVTIMYRMEGSPAVSGNIPFSDVASGLWYSDPILWASQNDVVYGYPDGTFGWDDPLTREQAVTILYRYSDLKGLDVSAAASLSRFDDNGSVSEWALPALQWAVAEGIIVGYTASTIAPGQTCTRAEVAAILMRYIEGVLES